MVSTTFESVLLPPTGPGGSTGFHTGVARLLVTAGVMLLISLVPAPARAAEGQEESREVIRAMIEAHGGMEKWRSAPTVQFEDEMSLPGTKPGRRSRVTVEQRSRRAYLDFQGTSARMTWDGLRAWSENWIMPTPPRFLALLNYYFLNLPWLTMDPGVQLGPPGTGRLWEDPTEYITVRMTFEPGTGDTPDDYYLLYIDPTTHRLRANKYIVTYRALLPSGAKSSPEHTLVYDEYARFDELLVPIHYTIYLQDHRVYASCAIRNFSFRTPFDETRMKMPAGAVVDTTQP